MKFAETGERKRRYIGLVVRVYLDAIVVHVLRVEGVVRRQRRDRYRTRPETPDLL